MGHESRSAHSHKAHAPQKVAVFVVTCSDSRDERSDESGTVIHRLLEGGGHAVVGQRVIRDDQEAIAQTIVQAKAASAKAMIITGGTGISRRDNTLEVLVPLFEKTLPGFGELFRQLSFQQIGSPAMLSRAGAGIYQGMVIFALPGSPQAVELAMKALILPELGHLVHELSR